MFLLYYFLTHSELLTYLDTKKPFLFYLVALSSAVEGIFEIFFIVNVLL